MALAVLVCMAMLVTVVPTKVAAALPSEQTFVTEGAEESTYDQWDERWDRFDANKDIASGGEDWWCRTMHEVHNGDHAIYCAKNGDNSHYYRDGTQCKDVNIAASSDASQKSDILRYDTGMDSVMRRSLDTSVRYYETVTVSFWFYSDTGHSDAKQPLDGSNVGYDFLNLVYWTGSGSTLTKHVAWTDTYAQATSKSWIQASATIPYNATYVGFEFVSGTTAPEGGDATDAFTSQGITIKNGGMKEGVFLDDISVVGSGLRPAEDLQTAAETLPEYENSLTFNVNWTNNDPQMGMKWIDLYYRVNGAGDWIRYETPLRPDGKFPNTTTSIEFTAPSEGSYEFFTQGTDNLNKVETARYAADASTKIDLTGPSSEIKFNGNGDGTNYKGTFSFSLSATDNVSGVDSIHYRLNGGSWNEYTSGVGIATNGTYKIEYFATDKAGNEEKAHSSTIVLTEAKPGITIDDPIIASNGTVTLNFTVALNGTSVTALQYSLDNGDFIDLDPTVRSVTFTDLKEGQHTLTIKATDSAGHVLQDSKTFSYKANGLSSILSNPLYLVGIIAVIAVVLVTAFWFVRRKR